MNSHCSKKESIAINAEEIAFNSSFFDGARKEAWFDASCCHIACLAVRQAHHEIFKFLCLRGYCI